MCFSSRSPAPPVNTPSYAPENADKHFTFSKEPPQDQTRTASPAAPAVKSVPQVKPKQEQIRM